MNLRRLINNWRNPLNETRIHLAEKIAKYGFDVGAYSYGNPKVRFPESGARLTIGKFCSIADRVEILLGGKHRTDWVTTFPFSAFRKRWPTAQDNDDHHATAGDITIGSDVWIGSQAMILSGVTIGHGAVIGARSVVAKDVAPYEIVVSAPARAIRKRFNDATIEKLLQSAWWDLPDDQISELVPLLQSQDVSALLEKVTELRNAGLSA
jgi:Acetyltransferase (isoleucine patch superfamily)